MGPNRRMLARVGTLVRGKWRIDEFLSRGSMAAVYSASHRNGTKAALKVLHEAYAKDEALTQRFIREGYMANSVEHPGTVKVVDDDVTDDGCAFLVMELLRGETLEDLRKKALGKLPIDDVLAWGDQLLAVLEAAHKKGVIHRDLKPENIFLTNDGEIKVLDWGVAQQWDGQASSEMTSTGMVLGTPAFMPPEQALGKRDEVDRTSDLWAVGATLFTLIAGEAVHPGADALAKLVATARNPARLLRSVDPTVPAPVAEAIDRSLSFQRADRYPTATAMRGALARARKARLEGPKNLDEVTVVNVDLETLAQSAATTSDDLENTADDMQVTELKRNPADLRATAAFDRPVGPAPLTPRSGAGDREPPLHDLRPDGDNVEEEWEQTARRDVPSESRASTTTAQPFVDEPSTERQSLERTSRVPETAPLPRLPLASPAAAAPAKDPTVHPSAAFALPLVPSSPRIAAALQPPLRRPRTPSMPASTEVVASPSLPPMPRQPSHGSLPPLHGSTSAPPPSFGSAPPGSIPPTGSVPPRPSVPPAPPIVSRVALGAPLVSVSRRPSRWGIRLFLLMLVVVASGSAAVLAMRHLKKGPFAPRPGPIAAVDAGSTLVDLDAGTAENDASTEELDDGGVLALASYDASTNEAGRTDAGRAETDAADGGNAGKSAPPPPPPATTPPAPRPTPSPRPSASATAEPLPVQIPAPLPKPLGTDTP